MIQKFIRKIVRNIKRLKGNKRAIIIQGIIAITFIMISSFVWVIMALVLNKTFDGFAPAVAMADPRVGLLSDSLRTIFALVILIIDVGLLIWWAVSTQRNETQEGAYSPYPV